MELHLTDDFDAAKIAASGQCFRWHPQGPNRFRIFAGAHTVLLTQTASDTITLTCTPQEFDTFWRDYFDLATD